MLNVNFKACLGNAYGVNSLCLPVSQKHGKLCFFVVAYIQDEVKKKWINDCIYCSLMSIMKA